MNNVLQGVLNHQIFQTGVAPLLVGLLVAGLGAPLRASGLAPAAGLFAAVYLMGTFGFEPLTPMRKIVLLSVSVPLLGLLVDLAFKPVRWTGVVIGVLFGLVSLWVFWGVLGQRPPIEAVAYASGLAGLVLAMVALTLPLHGDSVRAGAAGLGLAFGAGMVALYGAGALAGRYGIALGAANAGFLILVMALGPRVAAGAALTLGAAVAGALLAGAGVLQGKALWYAAALLLLVPLAVRLPVPKSAGPAVQVFIASFYALAAATPAGLVAWMYRPGG